MSQGFIEAQKVRAGDCVILGHAPAEVFEASRHMGYCVLKMQRPSGAVGMFYVQPGAMVYKDSRPFKFDLSQGEEA